MQCNAGADTQEPESKPLCHLGTAVSQAPGFLLPVRKMVHMVSLSPVSVQYHP